MIKNRGITVIEAGIDEVLRVNKNITEFTDDVDLNREYFEKRYEDKEHVVIVAYVNDIPIGYIVGYDECNDGKSFYVWMAAVDANYRRQGALTQLMEYQNNWAKSHGYTKLKIKTRNTCREMLSFLVKNGFNFEKIEKQENIIENRIYLEKIIQ